MGYFNFEEEGGIHSAMDMNKNSTSLHTYIHTYIYIYIYIR